MNQEIYVNHDFLALATIKLVTNSFSIMITLVTLVYIWEKWMRGYRVLHTHNKRLTLVLIAMGFGGSILNMIVPVTAEQCKVKRFH